MGAILLTIKEYLMLKTSSCPGATFVRDLTRYMNSPPPDSERSFALLQSFQPQGVTGITRLVDGAVTIYAKGDQRPVTMDIAYALAIFAGHAFGGSLRFNRRDKRSAPRSLAYLKTGPSCRTVAAVILDLEAHSFDCATQLNGDRLDIRKANLKLGFARKATHTTAPRRHFIEGALQLFDRHAPASIDLTREQYFETLCWAFELADFEHPTHRNEDGKA